MFWYNDEVQVCLGDCDIWVRSMICSSLILKVGIIKRVIYMGIGMLTRHKWGVSRPVEGDVCDLVIMLCVCRCLE